MTRFACWRGRLAGRHRQVNLSGWTAAERSLRKTGPLGWSSCVPKRWEATDVPDLGSSSMRPRRIKDEPKGRGPWGGVDDRWWPLPLSGGARMQLSEHLKSPHISSDFVRFRWGSFNTCRKLYTGSSPLTKGHSRWFKTREWLTATVHSQSLQYNGGTYCRDFRCHELVKSISHMARCRTRSKWS